MCQLGMSNEELMKFLTQETNKPGIYKQVNRLLH